MAGLPTLLDVIEARGRIARHIVRTPLHHYTALDRLIGAEVYVKHENHQLLGSFKMRGALNVVSQLGDYERERGVISASTGNFGQGIAYAARQFGLDASVAMPEDANPDKVESMRRLGRRSSFTAGTSTTPGATLKGWRARRATTTSTLPTTPA